MSSPLPAIGSALLLTCAAIAADEAVPAAQPQPVVAPRLLSLLPKYNPPKAGVTIDRRETDRPRNTIVRLPKDLLPAESSPVAAAASDNDGPAPEGVVRLPRYEVRERRLPAFKERELLAPAARVDLYLKRHPGLRIGNLFGLNRGIARAMIEEEDAYDRRLEMDELLAFERFANAQPRPNDEADAGESGGTPPSAAPGK